MAGLSLRQTYDRIAERWHERHASDDWWMWGTNVFARSLPVHARVLDAGCGCGTKTRYLASQGLCPFGIDMSPGMIQIARRDSPDLPEGTFSLMNMADAGLLGRTFRGVFMQASLLHVPKKDVPAMLRLMASLLLPGGLLYVAVKARRSDGPEEEVRVDHDYGMPCERFFSYFTPGELEGLLCGAGAVDIRATDAVSNGTRWIQMIAAMA